MIYYQSTFHVIPGKRDALINKYLLPCFEAVDKPCYEKVDKEHKKLKILGLFENMIGGDTSELTLVYVLRDLETLAKFWAEMWVHPAGIPIMEELEKSGPYFTHQYRKILTSTECDNIDWDSL